MPITILLTLLAVTTRYVGCAQRLPADSKGFAPGANVRKKNTGG
jgi:hypothetical protein